MAAIDEGYSAELDPVPVLEARLGHRLSVHKHGGRGTQAVDLVLFAVGPAPKLGVLDRRVLPGQPKPDRGAAGCGPTAAVSGAGRVKKLVKAERASCV